MGWRNKRIMESSAHLRSKALVASQSVFLSVSSLHETTMSQVVTFEPFFISKPISGAICRFGLYNNAFSKSIRTE